LNYGSSKPVPGTGRIPFCVSFGVTGHRFLPDGDQIAERVREIFQERFLECFDEESASALRRVRATPIAFTVVTPLATGADQLVARIAMEQQGRLEAVLPFEQEEYLKDFAPGPRADFDSLLRSATRCTPTGVKVSGAPDPDEAKREGYLKAGEYVVKHCDVVIAIWNEEPERGKGGTAEIVALALKSNKPTFIISATPPYQATLKNGGRLQGQSVQQIDESNSFPLADGEIRKRADEELAGIYNDPSCSEVPERLRQVVTGRLLPCFARASLVAEANQKRYQRTAMFAYLLTTVSVALLAIAVVWHDSPASLLCFCLESALLVLLYGMVHHAQKEQVHRKWLENRSLAERLRIALILVSCGVAPVRFSKTRRLLIDTETRDWISTGFESILEELPNMPEPTDEPCSRFGKHICTNWIQSQITYHERKAQKAELKNARLETGRNTAFLCALLLSIMHVIMKMEHLEAETIEKLISVVAITLPVAGAALEAFRTLMEYPRIASHSKAMKSSLEQLSDQPGKLTSHSRLAALLTQTGRLMLIESQDWKELLRFADLERTT